MPKNTGNKPDASQTEFGKDIPFRDTDIANDTEGFDGFAEDNKASAQGSSGFVSPYDFSSFGSGVDEKANTFDSSSASNNEFFQDTEETSTRQNRNRSSRKDDIADLDYSGGPNSSISAGVNAGNLDPRVQEAERMLREFKNNCLLVTAAGFGNGLITGGLFGVVVGTATGKIGYCVEA
jgi:hypothetical protein